MRELKELDNQHITKEIFDCWQQGKLNRKQEEEFLAHVGKCTFCAEQFAAFMEENLAEPPVYLEEEIVRRTKQLDVQAAIKVKQTSKQMQLMMYSLRVGLGVAASIFLLTITGSVQKTDLNVSKMPPDRCRSMKNRQRLQIS